MPDAAAAGLECAAGAAPRAAAPVSVNSIPCAVRLDVIAA